MIWRGGWSSSDLRCYAPRPPFAPGDALFVAAAVEHRFEDFSDDFGTWVMFYGPAGGEPPAS
jgi:hypothetical protein